MKPEIGITKKHLQNSGELLSTILSDEVILYTKTRKFHWNVSGESFMEFHKLFEGQYKQLEASIDEIAERIGKLGHNTIGTMNEFLKHSSLVETYLPGCSLMDECFRNSFIKEHPGKYVSTKDTLKELLEDHETVIVELRNGIDDCVDKNKDAGTADFLTGLMEQHETTAWVLRRYLN